MAYSVPAKSTFHFVGGYSTHTDCVDTNGGGCTKEAWEDIAKINQNISNVMNSGGGYLDNGTAGVISNNGSNKIRITQIGRFTNLSSSNYGVLVWCNFNAAGGYAADDGAYELIATDGSDYIDIEKDFDSGADTDCIFVVGGALNTLVDLLTDSEHGFDATNYHRRAFFSQTSEDLGGNLTIPGSAAGADRNVLMIITGYKPDGTANPLFNCCPNGQYYGGAVNAFLSKKDKTLWNTDSFWPILTQSGAGMFIIGDNGIVVENMRIQGDTDPAVYYSVASLSYLFRNCWIESDDASYIFQANTWAYAARIEDCLICRKSNTGSTTYGLYMGTCYGGGVYDSIVAGDQIPNPVYCGFGTFQNNLIYGGYYALLRSCVIQNNIFYNQTTYSMQQFSSVSYSYICNNIFMPALGSSDKIIYQSNSADSIVYAFNNNIIYAVDGNPVTDWYQNAQTNGVEFDDYDYYDNQWDVDPQFVDPTNMDFRLKPGSPALNKGRRGIMNGYNTIGPNYYKQRGQSVGAKT